jgi:hypothetical protein
LSFRRSWCAAAFIVLMPGGIFAVEKPPAGAPEQAQTAPAERPEKEWEFSVSGYGYLFPGEGDFFLGIATADRGRLHLETRYNYEDQDTASFWAGWNWATGEKVDWELTPMLGAVVGDTDAIAPGFELSLTWKRLDYYLESEVLLDLHSHGDSFTYAWSELGLSPVDWLRVGLVGQRTRVFESDLDIQRGIFAHAIVGRTTFGIDWFNPGGDDSFTIAVLTVEF